MMYAVVTGGGGFIGRHLTRQLIRHGWRVSLISRNDPPRGMDRLAVALSDRESRIAAALRGVDVVFHLAGIAHGRVARSDLQQLHEVNADVPRRLITAADKAAVPKLVAVSSIKVLGDVSERPWRPTDPYRPGDAYARSKMVGECALLDYPARTTQVAVVRPPLVYGPRVGGNFLALMRWVARGLPLPLAGAEAPRSMVGVDDLCSLLLCLGERGSGIFHVADARDRSVAELVSEIARLLDRPDRSWRVMPGVLKALARASGQGQRYSRLFEPLQVDQSATLKELYWRPDQQCEQLKATVRWFQQQQ